MALPENRKAVLELLDILRPQILGKTHPGFTCSCGAIHTDPAVAVEIIPGGDEYPSQEVEHSLWSVKMRNDHETWYLCLSEFIDYDTLDKMFAKYFGKNTRPTYPYSPKQNSSDRVLSDGEAIVCVREDDDSIEFSIDWGRFQMTANLILSLEKEKGSRISRIADPETFEYLRQVLLRIHPQAYFGGPQKVLPFESLWRVDYKKALDEVRQFDRVSLGSGRLGSGGKWYVTETSITFFKRPKTV